MTSLAVFENETKPITFMQALEQAELLARQALPQSQHERISCGVAIIQAGGVFETDTPHLWEVQSQSEPEKRYSINGHGCSCEDAFYRAPKGQCKHVLAVLLARKAVQLMQAAPVAVTVPAPREAEADEPAMAPSGTPDPRVEVGHGTVPRPYVQRLQGKDFVLYAGLLVMAHEAGLVGLEEHFTYNDADLSLAEAIATFADGRRFVGCGDATPLNAKMIGLAWRRMALTRAKARALRDALNIAMCAVEELEA